MKDKVKGKLGELFLINRILVTTNYDYLYCLDNSDLYDIKRDIMIKRDSKIEDIDIIFYYRNFSKYIYEKIESYKRVKNV